MGLGPAASRSKDTMPGQLRAEWRRSSDEATDCHRAGVFACPSCLAAAPPSTAAARRRRPAAPARGPAGRGDGLLRELLRRAASSIRPVRHFRGNRDSDRRPIERRPSVGAHLVGLRRREGVAGGRGRRGNGAAGGALCRRPTRAAPGAAALPLPHVHAGRPRRRGQRALCARRRLVRIRQYPAQLRRRPRRDRLPVRRSAEGRVRILDAPLDPRHAARPRGRWAGDRIPAVGAARPRPGRPRDRTAPPIRPLARRPANGRARDPPAASPRLRRRTEPRGGVPLSARASAAPARRRAGLHLPGRPALVPFGGAQPDVVSPRAGERREADSPAARAVAHPSGADGTNQRRVDDVASKWLDETHVRRRHPADGTNVDRPVEAVAGRVLHERVAGNRVNGCVPDLARGLARKHVENAERSLCSAGRDERSVPGRSRESIAEDRRRVAVLARALPPEESSDRTAQREQKPNRRIRGGDSLRQDGSQVGQCQPAPPSRKVDGPDVVQRNAGEEGVHLEIEAVPFDGTGSHAFPFRLHSTRSIHSARQTQQRCISVRVAVPCLDAGPLLLPRRGRPAGARGADDAQPPRAPRRDREPSPPAGPARAAARAAPPRDPHGPGVRVPERRRAARAGPVAPGPGIHRGTALRRKRAALPPRGGVHRLRQRPRVPLPHARARPGRSAAGHRVQHPGTPPRAARAVRGVPEPRVIEGLVLAAGSALLGGALALLARRRASLLELTRTFAFTAAAGVVAFHLLPEVLPALGPTALLWIAAGFVLPWLLEVGARVLGPDLLARRGIRGMRVAAEVGFAALLFHSLFEGLALLAALQGRDNRTDLEIAIVAHHAPLTAAVALPFLDLLGVRATLIRVGLVALAGIVGVVAGNLVPGLASGADAAVLQRATAVVAGALLHVVADEIREQRFSSAGARALDLLAAAAGLALAGLGAFLDARTTRGILEFGRTATALALGVAH